MGQAPLLVQSKTVKTSSLARARLSILDSRLKSKVFRRVSRDIARLADTAATRTTIQQGRALSPSRPRPASEKGQNLTFFLLYGIYRTPSAPQAATSGSYNGYSASQSQSYGAQYGNSSQGGGTLPPGSSAVDMSGQSGQDDEAQFFGDVSPFSLRRSGTGSGARSIARLFILLLGFRPGNCHYLKLTDACFQVREIQSATRDLNDNISRIQELHARSLDTLANDAQHAQISQQLNQMTDDTRQLSNSLKGAIKRLESQVNKQDARDPNTNVKRTQLAAVKKRLVLGCNTSTSFRAHKTCI